MAPMSPAMTSSANQLGGKVPLRHIEVHRVPVRVADRRREHCQVHHRGFGVQHGHEGGGDIGRADHTQMDDHLIVAYPPPPSRSNR